MLTIFGGHAPLEPQLATPMLHVICKRVYWVPAFNTMCNSNGVSILDFEASFDSGVGVGVQGGTSKPPRVLICQKSWQNL